MSAITKGPWTAELYTTELDLQGDLLEVELAGADGEPICRIDFESVGNTADAFANARAIAALPRLIEALQPFVTLAPYFNHKGNRPHNDSDPVYAVETLETGPVELTVADFRRAFAALQEAGALS